MEEPSSTSEAIAIAQVFAKKPFPRGSNEITACPICKGEEYDADFLGGDTNWAVCKNCGSGFKMFFPSDEEIFDFYKADYRLNETGSDYPLGSHRRTQALRTGRQCALVLTVLKQHKRFLDYGCALGWSVHTAEFLGMESYGVEPGEKDRKFAMNECGLKLH